MIVSWQDPAEVKGMGLGVRSDGDGYKSWGLINSVYIYPANLSSSAKGGDLITYRGVKRIKYSNT